MVGRMIGILGPLKFTTSLGSHEVPKSGVGERDVVNLRGKNPGAWNEKRC